jgi:hypothetical protein
VCSSKKADISLGRPRPGMWNAPCGQIVGPSVSIILDWLVPSRRHLEEERHRLEWTRDEEGLGDPHKGPIDLDSGVVKLQAPEHGDRQQPGGAENSVAEASDTEPVTKPAKP